MNHTVEEFKQILDEIQEYLTPKHIADDLGVSIEDVTAWIKCDAVPDNYSELTEKMIRSDIWENH